MENMSETDRKVMNFFLSGREAFEKVIANDLISCTDYERKNRCDWLLSLTRFQPCFLCSMGLE
jgi:hypothetical protein